MSEKKAVFIHNLKNSHSPHIEKMKDLIIETLHANPTANRAVEVVERKGTGHPDYICDAVMEAVSVALSREYLKRAGRVLHHNIDKGLLIAGSVEKHFGGGRVKTPMELIIGDRAAFSSGEVKIPVEDIARETARSWIGANLPDVDVDADIRIRVALAPGSEELAGIFNGKGNILPANDTSVAVGLAPMTETEEAVLGLERHINSPDFKARFPEVGSDVKVMGVRRGASLDLTVAFPLMARMIKNEREYFERKEAVQSALRDFLSSMPFSTVTLGINSLDRPGLKEKGVYISLLGTSAEDGDSGEVGRGNTMRGVIAPCRASSTEAAAGKNPVSHVGKIYSVLAQELAEKTMQHVPGVLETTVFLVSRIGRPVDKPAHAYVQVIPKSGYDEKRAESLIRDVVKEGLLSMDDLMGRLIAGEYPMC